MKYVNVTYDGLSNILFLFDDTLVHSTFVKNLGLTPGAVHSAGFVQRGSDGTLIAYGESTTLKKKSDPENDNIYLRIM